MKIYTQEEHVASVSAGGVVYPVVDHVAVVPDQAAAELIRFPLWWPFTGQVPDPFGAPVAASEDAIETGLTRPRGRSR